MRVYCGILAAGTGERFLNKKIPKQLLPVGGSTLFTITLDKVKDSGLFDSIVVAILKKFESSFLNCIKSDPDYGLTNEIMTATGGKTRMDSILSLIEKINENYKIEDEDIFCLVDSNRPLIDKDLYESVIEAAAKYSISCPSSNLIDGVGFVKNGFITDIPDKVELQSIQTPEACNYKKLLQLIESGEHLGKLGLCEIFLGVGIQPKVVEGDYRTYKITYPRDIQVVEAFLNNENKI